MKNSNLSVFLLVALTTLFYACGTSSSSSKDSEDEIFSSDSAKGNSSGKENGNSSSSFVADAVTKAEVLDVSKLGLQASSVTAADGIVYKVINLGPVNWIAENMTSTEPFSAKSTCYGYDDSMCESYGRLYLYNGESNPEAVCPEGYQLPSAGTWAELAESDLDFNPVFAGSCSKRDTLECENLKTTVRYLADGGKAIVFTKDANGKISYKIQNAELNGFYSLRCVQYRSIVSKMIELPMCNDLVTNMPSVYVLEKKESYYCSDADEKWEESSSTNVCGEKEAGMLYQIDGDLLVCRENWHKATIRDVDVPCDEDNLYKEVMLNDERYVCTEHGWFGMGFPASVLGYCREEFYGKISKTAEDMSYVCDSTGWQKATKEMIYGECDRSNMDKAIEYDEHKYICDGNGNWELGDSQEQEIGFCLEDLYDSVRAYDGTFYRCDPDYGEWVFVSPLEYLGDSNESRMWDTVQAYPTVYMCNGKLEWQEQDNAFRFGLCTDENLGEIASEAFFGINYQCSSVKDQDPDGSEHTRWLWALYVPTATTIEPSSD